MQQFQDAGVGHTGKTLAAFKLTRENMLSPIAVRITDGEETSAEYQMPTYTNIEGHPTHATVQVIDVGGNVFLGNGATLGLRSGGTGRSGAIDLLNEVGFAVTEDFLEYADRHSFIEVDVPRKTSL